MQPINRILLILLVAAGAFFYWLKQQSKGEYDRQVGALAATLDRRSLSPAMPPAQAEGMFLRAIVIFSDYRTLLARGRIHSGEEVYLKDALTAAGYVSQAELQLVSRTLRDSLNLLNGQPSTIREILQDPRLASLLSDEITPVPDKPAPDKSGDHGEILTTVESEPGVRMVVNRPAMVDPAKPVRLALYALPNGNTIEQTMGRHAAPGEDWHFGIQHIAAQTRWLRERQPETTLVVAYLECAEKSWPAWVRKHPDSGMRIAAVTGLLRRQFAGPSLKMVLTGHSGGGAFIFRYLDSQETIPDEVERIAFLDSNYAYDAAKGHAAKLAAWLGGAPERSLTVIAYHDSIALLDGKTFVSEKGGTWGRSHAMLEDLGKTFAFTKTVEGLLQKHRALDGRITFLLRENPEKAVLHTRLVERNGYLHALLTGTPAENQGYQFFGEPVYRSLISGP